MNNMRLSLNEEYIKSKTEEFFDNTKPICSICNKEVDNVDYMQEFATMDIHIKVYCHGDEETRKIPLEFFSQYGFKNIKQGKAFDIRRMEDGREKEMD